MLAAAAEEEILLAEHLLEALEIESKCGCRLSNPHARHIGAKHVPVFGESLEGFGRHAAEHVRKSGRLQGKGNHRPK